jgi:poly-gamma-glutamate capsule biosynthesis protein CapA/YwtB (metallophosphatase superfamily)
MKKTYKKLYLKKWQIYSCILLFLIIASLSGCNSTQKDQPIVLENQDDGQNSSALANNTSITPTPTEAISTTPQLSQTEIPAIATSLNSFIDDNGTTLESRIHTPKGFVRIPTVSDEFTGFVRGLVLKEAGSEVLLYDGLPKGNQDDHVAVFDLDLGDRDLQQCADSLIRVYAEYYWSIGAYDKIAFHLTNGFLMEYTKWRAGNRIVVNGNDVRWSKTKTYDDSYEEFRRYLTMVFNYAGTLSLSTECTEITLEEMRPGDMFLQGGSPGHCILVVDVAQNQDGTRCYLLAQGYMPAQDFHVLKNPLHPEDPWYYASEITYPLTTPSWQFDEGSLVRWGSYPLNEAGVSLIFSELNAIDNSSNAYTASDAVPAMSTDVSIVKEENPTQITLLAVGDNLIHIEVVQDGKQADGSYDFNSIYSNLADEIAAADIAVINQETILGGTDFAYSGYPNFNSPTEIGDAIINAGFDVILHATNHTLDMGVKGVENTIEYWKQHPEITVLGMNESLEESKQIPIVEKNGIKLALLNYTYSLNGYSLPKGKPYLVNLLDKEKMSEDIKKAEALADFTIVFPHWGSEYVYEANDAQKDLTEFYYEQGVDLIIGTHPHVLEPVEWIETTKNHRMLVYYSLGNFMSYQKEAPRMLGGMAQVTITKDKSGTYISESHIIPTVTHYESGPTDFSLHKLRDYTEELAKAHGVSDIAKQGAITYQGTLDLAKHVLGPWFE